MWSLNQMPRSLAAWRAGRGLPPLFWTFSSVFGEIKVLFPDPRDQHLGLKGEFTERHFTVEMPAVGASAQDTPGGDSSPFPDHRLARRTRRPARGLSQLPPGVAGS